METRCPRPENDSPNEKWKLRLSDARGSKMDGVGDPRDGEEGDWKRIIFTPVAARFDEGQRRPWKNK